MKKVILILVLVIFIIGCTKEAPAEKCEKITERYSKDTCYRTVAKETQDASLCEKITDSIGKDICYSDIIPTIKDVSLCKKITKNTIKERCYTYVAINTKDTNICEKITNSDEKNYCYAIITNDATSCEKISKSLTVKGFDDYHSFVFAKSMCYLKIAIGTKDSSLCEKITDDEEKDWCYTYFAKENKDISACEKITAELGVYSRGPCYVKVAVETEDSSLCEEITDRFSKDCCYEDIAVKTGDGSLCAKKVLDVDQCYRKVVEVTKDTSWCEKMTTSHRKEDCYFYTAIETEDKSLCEKIINSSKKDWCYSRIARERKPVIEEEEEREMPPPPEEKLLLLSLYDKSTGKPIVSSADITINLESHNMLFVTDRLGRGITLFLPGSYTLEFSGCEKTKISCLFKWYNSKFTLEVKPGHITEVKNIPLTPIPTGAAYTDTPIDVSSEITINYLPEKEIPFGAESKHFKFYGFLDTPLMDKTELDSWYEKLQTLTGYTPSGGKKIKLVYNPGAPPSSSPGTIKSSMPYFLSAGEHELSHAFATIPIFSAGMHSKAVSEGIAMALQYYLRVDESKEFAEGYFETKQRLLAGDILEYERESYIVETILWRAIADHGWGAITEFIELTKLYWSDPLSANENSTLVLCRFANFMTAATGDDYSEYISWDCPEVV